MSKIWVYALAWCLGMFLASSVRYAVYWVLPPHWIDMVENLKWAVCFVPAMMLLSAICKRIDRSRTS